MNRNETPAPEQPEGGILHVSSMYGFESRKPMVVLTYDAPGREFNVTMSVEAARNHAQDVLEVCESAVADAFLFEFIQEKVGVSDTAAARVIQDFRVWRQEHRV